MKKSAASIVEQGGLVLCVWNTRFRGWVLPSGKVENGESMEECQRRELREETDMETRSATLVYRGEMEDPRKGVEDSIGTVIVSVYEVDAYGDARGVEPGCPISWMTREDLVRQSPFGEFYSRFLIKEGVSHGSSAPPPS